MMSSILPVLAELAALTGTACLLGMALTSLPRHHIVYSMAGATVLGSLLAQFAAVEAGWCALALAAGAMAVCWSHAGVGLLVVGWGALTLATWRCSLALSAEGTGAALVVPALLGAAGASGYRLRRHLPGRDRAEAMLLVLLAAPTVAAGPTVALAWQRAAIAAEGRDAPVSGTVPVWPFLLALAAAVAGFVWRLFHAAPSRPKGTLSCM